MDKETMRTIRMSVGVAAALCALAVAAVPAMAHQFVASKAGKTSAKGYEEIPQPEKGSGEQPEYIPERMQEFKLGQFKILCYSARGKGEITETSSETFQTTTKYTRCGWYPKTNSLHVAATFSKSGLTVIYHANGYVEGTGNGEGEETEWKKAVVLETAAYIKISSTKLCKIIIPEQTIPVQAVKKPTGEYSSAVYSNLSAPVNVSKTFPSGLQERLLITNDFKGMKYKYGGEETQCATSEEFEKTSEEGGGGASGAYKGTLEEQLIGGNLKFE